jgi:hypothetical protein
MKACDEGVSCLTHTGHYLITLSLMKAQFFQPKREDGKQPKCRFNDASPTTHKHTNTTATDIPAATIAPPVWLLAQGAVSKVLHTFRFASHHLDNEWHWNKWQTLHLSFFSISKRTANRVGRLLLHIQKVPGSSHGNQLSWPKVSWLSSWYMSW